MRILFFRHLSKLAFTAFTLAEVLITLGIIGVVASLTIPTLVKTYQKQVYATAQKKAYTELSQVFKLYMAHEGVMDLSQTSMFATNNNYDKLNEIVKKYFKVAKPCWDEKNQNYDNSCKITESYLDPSFSYISQTFYPSFFTSDGRGFDFGLADSSDCKPNYDIPSNMKGVCIYVNVDINGPKPPNKWGRDYVMSYIIKPDGNVTFQYSREFAQYRQYIYTGQINNWDKSNYYWRSNKACGNEGSSIVAGILGDCAARLQDEGWQMTY